MEYAFGEGIVLGLREAGRFDRIVDVGTCLLMSPESLELVQRVRQWAKDYGLTGYNRRTHQGDLRYLVTREGKNTGQRMGILIASEGADALQDLRQRIEPLVTTFYIGFTNSPGDVAQTNDMHLLWGPGWIEEKARNLRFRISPYSFFQTNTHGTEVLYGLLQQWAAPIGGALLDAYCGSGGIALSLAKRFDRVVGVDSNPEAIRDAVFNAASNNLSNTEFVTEDMIPFLQKLQASKLAVQLSAVVIDPPRPGLHPKAMKALLELNPPRLAYVSCNPEALARDLQNLIPFYRMRSAQCIDLFPHTPHVETLVTLEHR